MPRQQLFAMRCCGLALGPLVALSVALAIAGGVYVLDPATADLVYDGHGALSAGASSRLLYDYDEPYRTQASKVT